MGDFLTRNGITIWAENSDYIPYPVLKIEDKPSKVVAVHFGVIESPNHKRKIFRIGWSRSAELQGSYYCTVHAFSDQLAAPSRSQPIKSHSPPEIYRWMIEAPGKTFSSRAQGEHGWPMSAGPVNQDGRNLANISFKVERIRNAADISKLLEALGPGNKRLKKEASLERLRERGICVVLEQEPHVLFKIFFELVPSTQVPMPNALTGPTPHGHKPRVRRPRRVLEPSDESEYRPRKRVTKRSEVMSRRSAMSRADRTVQSTSRALSIVSATEDTRAPSSSVEALNVQRLKNLAQEHEELNKKILELINAKEKQNQKLHGVLLEYGK
ncbi:hypothetical protein BJ165DRAFT_1506226 [Panaeolus papilionaceus]|nr:hypothetical protein BJ165DRAFT_1506226 [Panaeolus papilionaceus]